MFRLLADEDVPLEVVEHLRAAWGFDVLRLRDFDLSRSGDSRDDPAVLAEANREERAVLTHNRKDFRRLHHATALSTPAGGDHWGIVTYRTSHDFAIDADSIAWTIFHEVDAHGSIEGRYLQVERWFQRGLLDEKLRSGG